MRAAWTPRPRRRIDLDAPGGERFQSLAEAELAPCRELAREILALLPPKARALAYGARLLTNDRFQAEMELLAVRLALSWEEVMLCNLSYDLAIAALGCSTLLLPTADGPVLARNMDWMPERLLARSSCILEYVRQGAPCFSQAGWPCAVGLVSGLSQRGFGLVLNAVGAPEKTNLRGYPLLLFLRRVVEEAGSFEEALAMLCREPLTVSGLISLAGSENRQRVVIERSPTRHALRWGEAGRALLATNHYRGLYQDSSAPAALAASTCGRYERLQQLWAGRQGANDVCDERLLASLADPGVLQEITAQHVILRPRQGLLGLWVPTRCLD